MPPSTWYDDVAAHQRNGPGAASAHARNSSGGKYEYGELERSREGRANLCRLRRRAWVKTAWPLTRRTNPAPGLTYSLRSGRPRKTKSSDLKIQQACVASLFIQAASRALWSFRVAKARTRRGDAARNHAAGPKHATGLPFGPGLCRVDEPRRLAISSPVGQGMARSRTATL